MRNVETRSVHFSPSAFAVPTRGQRSSVRIARRSLGKSSRSAAAHLAGKDDGLVRVRPLLELVPRWGRYLSADPDEETVRRLRRHEGTGRPLGGERFLQRLEKIVGRLLRPRRPGRNKKNREN